MVEYASSSGAAGQPLTASSMRRPWEISERAAQALLFVMVAIKIAVTAYNAQAFDGQSYDYRHHLSRAFAGGLVPHKMNYDPPLYYLPALAYRQVLERSGIEGRLNDPAASSWTNRQTRNRLSHRVIYFLRVTNVLYAGIFYVCWCFFAFPRLLRDWRSAFLASALLLCLPGYQKLGVMPHADNLFAASAALCTVAWLALHERQLARGPQLEARYWLALAAAAGVVGLSRPFAVVPVALFALVAASYALRGETIHPLRAAGRLVAIGALAGTLAVAWYAYRWQASGTVLNAYKEEYIGRFNQHRDQFDFIHYFTSFSLPQLLENPNRNINGSGPFSGNDSFFTLLYSEVWGDHWLYFSGSEIGDEGKIWPKRVLLLAALPVVPWLLYGAWRSLREWRERLRETLVSGASTGLQRLKAVLAAHEQQVVVAVWLLAAASLYLYWQTGPALLPGKNSTIKFIYTATFYPLVIALATNYRPSRGFFNASAYYLMLLYAISLPVAIFRPT